MALFWQKWAWTNSCLISCDSASYRCRGGSSCRYDARGKHAHDLQEKTQRCSRCFPVISSSGHVGACYGVWCYGGRILFPERGGASLDSQHSFTVQYQLGGDRNLGFHVDDSDVTMNLCLGKTFEGGDLFFRGLIDCPETHSQYEEVPHQMQYALVRGSLLPGAVGQGSQYRVLTRVCTLLCCSFMRERIVMGPKISSVDSAPT